MKIIEDRNIAVYVILTILTCGIFGIYWLYTILSDLYFLTGQENNAILDMVFTIVTCGFYGIYLAWKIGSMLENSLRSKGVAPASYSVIFLILSIVRLNFLNFILVQNEINKNFAINNYYGSDDYYVNQNNSDFYNKDDDKDNRSN